MRSVFKFAAFWPCMPVHVQTLFCTNGHDVSNHNSNNNIVKMFIIMINVL